MSATPLVDPVVTSIAAAHKRTPAAVMLAWHYQNGFAPNPRTFNATHMLDNLNAFDIVLDEGEMGQLNSRPQDWCAVDPNMYECAPETM